ncbi:MAG: hypothetical protein QNJ47_28100, partial [Nostocaceae cyanobacterium]|nr:hypothetical protein [Nostocaceae cyanobacterium]
MAGERKNLWENQITYYLLLIALPNLLKYKRAGKDAPQSLQRGEPQRQFTQRGKPAHVTGSA